MRGIVAAAIAILEPEQTDTYDLVDKLRNDTWTRITVEIVPTSRTGALRLFHDGRPVFTTNAQPFSTGTNQTEVYLGLVRFDAPAPAMTVRYDNVTIESLP